MHAYGMSDWYVFKYIYIYECRFVIDQVICLFSTWSHQMEPRSSSYCLHGHVRDQKLSICEMKIAIFTMILYMYMNHTIKTLFCLFFFPHHYRFSIIYDIRTKCIIFIQRMGIREYRYKYIYNSIVRNIK